MKLIRRIVVAAGAVFISGDDISIMTAASVVVDCSFGPRLPPGQL